MESSSLRELWHAGRPGCMSPWHEAKALALRDAWRIFKPGGEYGMHQFIADHIDKAMRLSGKGGSWKSFADVRPGSHER